MKNVKLSDVVYRNEYSAIRKWVEDKWNERVLRRANNQAPAIRPT